MIKGFLPGKDKKKKKVHLYFFNFTKAKVYVNQKQGTTF